MALVYGSNFTNKKPLPQLIKTSSSNSFENVWSYLLNAARFFIDVIIDKVIANAVSIIPGLGFVARSAIKLVAGTVSEIMQDLLFDKKIEWKSLWWRIGLRVVSLGMAGFRSLKKSSKFVKKILDHKGYKFTEKYLKDLRGLYYNGASHFLTIAKRESLRIVYKNAQKIKFKNIPLTKINNLSKAIKTGTKLIQFANNPINFAANNIKQQTSKIINSKIKIASKNLQKKWMAKTNNNQKLLKTLKNDMHNKLVLNSSWIWGLKVFDSNKWDLSKNITYTIYFKYESTNKKLPIVRWEVPYSEFQGWISAPSPGRYYLDNIAWGYQVRKWIGKEFIFASAQEAKSAHSFFGKYKNQLLEISNTNDFQNTWDFGVSPYKSGLRSGRKTGNLYPIYYANNPKEIRFTFASQNNPFNFKNHKRMATQRITRYKFKGVK